jgi:hypothetical protein
MLDTNKNRYQNNLLLEVTWITLLLAAADHGQFLTELVRIELQTFMILGKLQMSLSYMESWLVSTHGKYYVSLSRTTALLISRFIYQEYFDCIAFKHQAIGNITISHCDSVPMAWYDPPSPPSPHLEVFRLGCQWDNLDIERLIWKYLLI